MAQTIAGDGVAAFNPWGGREVRATGCGGVLLVSANVADATMANPGMVWTRAPSYTGSRSDWLKNLIALARSACMLTYPPTPAARANFADSGSEGKPMAQNPAARKAAKACKRKLVVAAKRKRRDGRQHAGGWYAAGGDNCRC